MPKKPLVSTITPCYKMQDYLPKFLDQLPDQTYFEHTQIVLDHNDPLDEEVELVRLFQKDYPGKLKHVITSPVEPIGVSMNTCIQEADGELLTIWNVDDLRTPDSIEKQVQAYVETNCRVIHGNFVIVNSFGSTHGRYIDHTHTLINPEELQRGMCIGPFFMFHKSLLEVVFGFDEQLRSGADFDLAVRLAKASDVGMAPGILGYYLDEGKGASTRGDGRQPIERTVIELRYGMHDKVERQYVPEAEKYDIQHIVVKGQKVDVWA